MIAAYLVATAVLGLKLSGKQTGLKDYFLSGRDLPWWAVCMSVVATETSALTVIGISVVTILYSFIGGISLERPNTETLQVGRTVEHTRTTALRASGLNIVRKGIDRL